MADSSSTKAVSFSSGIFPFHDDECDPTSHPELRASRLTALNVVPFFSAVASLAEVSLSALPQIGSHLSVELPLNVSYFVSPCFIHPLSGDGLISN